MSKMPILIFKMTIPKDNFKNKTKSFSKKI